jgi:hypothetical protein
MILSVLFGIRQADDRQRELVKPVLLIGENSPSMLTVTFSFLARVTAKVPGLTRTP